MPELVSAWVQEEFLKYKVLHRHQIRTSHCPKVREQAVNVRCLKEAKASEEVNAERGSARERERDGGRVRGQAGKEEANWRTSNRD